MQYNYVIICHLIISAIWNLLMNIFSNINLCKNDVFYMLCLFTVVTKYKMKHKNYNGCNWQDYIKSVIWEDKFTPCHKYGLRVNLFNFSLHPYCKSCITDNFNIWNWHQRSQELYHSNFLPRWIEKTGRPSRVRAGLTLWHHKGTERRTSYDPCGVIVSPALAYDTMKIPVSSDPLDFLRQIPFLYLSPALFLLSVLGCRKILFKVAQLKPILNLEVDVAENLHLAYRHRLGRLAFTSRNF